MLDEIPSDTVFFQAYPTAVYLHQAQEYVITKVDNDSKVVLAKKCVTPLKYFTTCKDITYVDVVRVQSTHRVQADADAKDDKDDSDTSLSLSLGVVSVLTRVYGAKVLEKRSMRLLHSNEFSLPPMQTFGNALWLELPTAVKTCVVSAGFNWLGALHGVGHLCIALVPLFVLCESADVDTEHYDPNDQRVRYGLKSLGSAADDVAVLAGTYWTLTGVPLCGVDTASRSSSVGKAAAASLRRSTAYSRRCVGLCLCC